MRIEISELLVAEHVQRLRDAAQIPTSPLVERIWSFVSRRRRPAGAVGIPHASEAHEIERLAA
jgi:hypothetical protein